MPELPEVETIRLGLIPEFVSQKFTKVIIRTIKLRWPIPKNLSSKLKNQKLVNISRRGKYLLFHIANGGILIIHLGMTGKLLIQPIKHQLSKHEHAIFEFSCGKSLSFVDPRRFGSILWVDNDLELQHHPLLKHLGVEPLLHEFNVKYLWEKVHLRKAAIKLAIMDGSIVVGIGNIYAAEALFLAGIRPDRNANSLTYEEINTLVKVIKNTLRLAIKKGGTTFRDYLKSDGSVGEFIGHLNVYGRAGQPCLRCGRPLLNKHIGGRSTVFCAHCQH